MPLCIHIQTPTPCNKLQPDTAKVNPPGSLHQLYSTNARISSTTSLKDLYQQVRKSGHLDKIPRKTCPAGAEIGTPGQDSPQNMSSRCGNRDTWTRFLAKQVQQVRKSGHLDKIPRKTCPAGAEIGTPGQDSPQNMSSRCRNWDTWTRFPAKAHQVGSGMGHLVRFERFPTGLASKHQGIWEIANKSLSLKTLCALSRQISTFRTFFS